MAKPFIKWAGGKSQMLDTLIEKMPKKYGRYIEPFLGGGALFLKLNANDCVVGDMNAALINCYLKIFHNADIVYHNLKFIEDEFNALDSDDAKKDFYYAKRTLYNDKIASNIYDFDVAILLIFLNKTCFNGLYRENKKGEFNVPFGHKKSIHLADKDNLLAVQKRLLQSTMIHGDFEDVVKFANPQKGDFVFFDSPYVDTYTSYLKNGFQENDHQRLKILYDSLTKQGVYCMATNNACDIVKNLYNQYNIQELSVNHYVNRDGNNRTATEYIITNY